MSASQAISPNRLVLILSLSAASAMLLACFLGSTPMGVGRLLSAVVGVGSESDQIIIWQIRVPRAVAAFTVGASLGLTGAALQGLFRNPLAGPGVLGVSSLAVLGAVLAIVSGLSGIAFVLPLASIAFAVGGTALIAVAAFRTKSIQTLILLGVGLSSFAGAVLALIMNFAPNPFSLAEMINWTLGSVSYRGWGDILVTLPFMTAGVGVLLWFSRGLSVLGLGEETAASAGVDLNTLRLSIALGAGLATGASVALAGAIGFVGITAPHIARAWVGHDPARLLIPAGLLGGIMLVLADIGVRLLPTHTELKLGVVAALIGAPIFVLIALKERRIDG